MRLYLASRVAEVEQSDEWIAWKVKRDARGQVGKVTADKRRKELFAWLDAQTITVQRVEQVIQRACDHYNERQKERYWKRGEYEFPEPVTTECDPDFLDRIAVNFLRHCHTEYDSVLNQLTGKVGKTEACILIKIRVLKEIAKAYPHLRQECQRQIDSQKCQHQHGLLI